MTRQAYRVFFGDSISFTGLLPHEEPEAALQSHTDTADRSFYAYDLSNTSPQEDSHVLSHHIKIPGARYGRTTANEGHRSFYACDLSNPKHQDDRNAFIHHIETTGVQVWYDKHGTERHQHLQAHHIQKTRHQFHYMYYLANMRPQDDNNTLIYHIKITGVNVWSGKHGI